MDPNLTWDEAGPMDEIDQELSIDDLLTEWVLDICFECGEAFGGCACVKESAEDEPPDG